MEGLSGGLVVKNPHSQSRGHGFILWSGNKDPTCSKRWPGGEKKTQPKVWDSWDSESFWVGEQVEVPGGGAPGEDIETLCPSPILCPTLLSGCS